MVHVVDTPFGRPHHIQITPWQRERNRILTDDGHHHFIIRIARRRNRSAADRQWLLIDVLNLTNFPEIILMFVANRDVDDDVVARHPIAGPVSHELTRNRINNLQTHFQFGILVVNQIVNFCVTRIKKLSTRLCLPHFLRLVAVGTGCQDFTDTAGGEAEGNVVTTGSEQPHIDEIADG